MMNLNCSKHHQKFSQFKEPRYNVQLLHHSFQACSNS